MPSSKAIKPRNRSRGAAEGAPGSERGGSFETPKCDSECALHSDGFGNAGKAAGGAPPPCRKTLPPLLPGVGAFKKEDSGFDELLVGNDNMALEISKCGNMAKNRLRRERHKQKDDHTAKVVHKPSVCHNAPVNSLTRGMPLPPFDSHHGG
ncbi:hypothetical protein EYF80_001346 [Liparis tanakae]|uniref:Uncharacterized protein n=1 Tax=Liparis tanakae TaxID=230148 RepID=A0A4Z2JFI1_9TELE|nr:hypothetical protein EYF80_001346 [Liparis tanakae]